MDKLFKRLGLKFNPFEPSASGAPISHDLVIPQSWRNDIETIIKTIQRGRGVKAVVIQGEYGSGKTYLLPLRYLVWVSWKSS